MKVVKVCRIGENYSLGRALGLDRRDHERIIWAVLDGKQVNGAVEYQPNNNTLLYALSFDTYEAARKYCEETKEPERHGE